MEKVYKDKEYCSGCGACVEICPQNAISMQYDEAGFLYPLIDKKICIDCEACSKMCSFRNTVKHTNSKCFAGVNIDVSQMMKSTSAGIFAGIASEFLRDGLVCGAEMKYQKNNSDLTLQNIVVEHTLVKDVRELIKLQGSKYVQSNLYACLDELKQALKNGEKVLFSGTPCQVASVKSLFSKYVGTQLYTIDIICHGVPNQQILNDYLIMFQKVHEVTLKELIFRDKQYGWRLDGKIVAVKPNNEKFEFKFSPKNSSFYRFFLDGEIYRDNCYHCPYACQNRVGDITIGDYWGVEKYDPQLLKANGGEFIKENGVSCVLINSDNGLKLIEKYGRKIALKPVDINKIMVINKQLERPATYSKMRKKIFETYESKGYLGVEKLYRKKILGEKCKMKIKKVIPKFMKSLLKSRKTK